MSFIEMPIGEAVEKEVLPEGTYSLVVDDATYVERDGKRRISIRHTVEGEAGVKTIFHNIFLDLSDDEEKANTQLLFTKAYLELFEIPYKDNGFALDDIIGSRADCSLIINEYNGVESNQIKLTI